MRNGFEAVAVAVDVVLCGGVPLRYGEESFARFMGMILRGDFALVVAAFELSEKTWSIFEGAEAVALAIVPLSERKTDGWGSEYFRFLTS